VVLDDNLYARIVNYSEKRHIGKLSTAIRVLLAKALEVEQ